MKHLLFLFVLTLSTSLAGQLDIAVVQYTVSKDADQLAAGFAEGNLAKLTNGGSITSGDRYIRGGSVLFAQSIPANPGSSLSTVTRVGEQQMDVKSSLNGLVVTTNITLATGVKQLLRSYTEQHFTGSGDLSSHRPTIIAIQGTSGRNAVNMKGRVSVKTIGYTTLVLAQYH